MFYFSWAVSFGMSDMSHEQFQYFFFLIYFISLSLTRNIARVFGQKSFLTCLHNHLPYWFSLFIIREKGRYGMWTESFSSSSSFSPNKFFSIYFSHSFIAAHPHDENNFEWRILGNSFIFHKNIRFFFFEVSKCRWRMIGEAFVWMNVKDKYHTVNWCVHFKREIAPDLYHRNAKCK